MRIIPFLDAPQLTMLPTHSVYHVRVNTSLQLVCIAEGYPIPSVRWYKIGVPITYYKQSFHTLHVSSKVLSTNVRVAQPYKQPHQKGNHHGNNRK